MRKHVFAVLFLIFLIFVFFSKEIFSKKSMFAPVDSIYLFSPWNEYKNIIPQNFQQSDALFQFIPWRFYAYHQLRDGHFPLWNPYEFGGIPFFSNDQSGVLSPFNIFGLFFSFDKGFLIINILKLIVSAIGMYLFLNFFQLDKASCMFGSISYTFSALMILWLYHPLSCVVSLAPWLFLAFEQIYKSVISGVKSKIAVFVTSGAFIIAIAFFSGHSETTINLLFGLTIYIITKAVVDHKKTGLIVLIFIITITSGFLLSAVQIIPFLHMLFNSVPFYNRSTIPLDYKIYLPLYSAFLWLVPNIIGNPSFSYFWMKLPQGFHEATPYIGIAPLFLGLFTVLNIKTNYKKILPFWVMAFVGFGMSYGLPIVKWLTMLPIIRAGGSFRYIILVEFGLSALSAFGLNTLIYLNMQTNILTSGKKNKTIMLLLIVCFICILLYWLTRYNITFVATLFGDITFKRFAIFDNPETLAFSLIQIVISLLFIFVTIWLVYKIYKKQIYGMIVPISFIILTICDLFIFGIGYNPNVPQHDFYPYTPIINKLKSLDTKNYTFYASDSIIPPDISMVYSLRDFRGYDIIPSIEYQNFLKLLFPDENTNLGELGMVNWPEHPSLIISSIASIKYFIFPEDFDFYPQNKFVKLIKSYRGLSIWENSLALPRYYLAITLQPALSSDDALTLLSKITISTIHNAIVQGINKPCTYVPNLITVTQIAEKPGEYVFNIQAHEQGFFVLNEPFYPGWHAYIENKPTTIYHTNYLFQGIKLNKGNYKVKFKYKPESFYTGVYISTGTMTIVLILLLANILKGLYRHNIKLF